MSYDLYVARGNPKHLAGRLEKLKPLDEGIVRQVLRAPPAGVELHDSDGDEVLWAGEAVIAQMLLARSDDGTLRSVEAGLSSTGEGDYVAEFAAMATRLLDLADGVRGRLYRESFDKRGRMGRDEIERMASRPRDAAPSAPAEPRPQLLLDFYELDDAEAEAYLEQHVAGAPERLAAFRQEIAALGGPADLEATTEGLDRLGDWLVDSLPRRYAGLREPTPDERTLGSGIVQMTASEWRRQWPDEPRELPPWCAPGAENARSPLPPTGLWLADGLGYYLGECLSRELGELRWDVYRASSRRLRDVDENAPVLATSSGTFNAHSAAYGIVLRALAYRRREPSPLAIYQSALERLRGA
jgi:hypothetical protein